MIPFGFLSRSENCVCTFSKRQRHTARANINPKEHERTTNRPFKSNTDQRHIAYAHDVESVFTIIKCTGKERHRKTYKLGETKTK